MVLDGFILFAAIDNLLNIGSKIWIVILKKNKVQK